MKRKHLFQIGIFVLLITLSGGTSTAYAQYKSCTCESSTSLVCTTVYAPSGDGGSPSYDQTKTDCPVGCDNNHQPPECNPTPSYPTSPTGGAVNPPAPPLQYTPLEPLPFINYQNEGSPSFFPNLINGVLKLLLSVGAVFAVIMIVFAGISYMTSEVGGKKEAAKKRAQAAVMGLLLLLGAYLILKTINPNLLNVSLPLPSLTTTPVATSTSPGPTAAQICGSAICADGNNDLIDAAIEANTAARNCILAWGSAAGVAACATANGVASLEQQFAEPQYDRDKKLCQGLKNGTPLVPSPSESQYNCSTWDRHATIGSQAAVFSNCYDIPNYTNVSEPIGGIFNAYNTNWVCGYNQ